MIYIIKFFKLSAIKSTCLYDLISICLCLKGRYCDIVDAISIFNASGLINEGTQLTGKQARALTEQAKQLEQQIASLRAQLKKETQFNRRVELNMEIKKLEAKKSEILV
jgi:transposase